MSETLSIPVRLENLALVYIWVDAFADRHGLPRPCRVALQIVVEEAVSNVIRHGYPDAPADPDHRIWLTLAVEGETVELSIEDQALPFDPRSVAPPPRGRSLEAVQPGGEGINLIRRKTRSMEYQRRDGWNRLTLRFDRAGPAPGIRPASAAA